MSFPSFLEMKEKREEDKGKKTNKKDYRERCVDLLEKIKKESEEIYALLHKDFKLRFDKDNISKKQILGFYGQLVDELKSLKASTIPSEVFPSVKGFPKKPRVEKKKVVKKEAKKATPEKKKAVKKAAKKKTAGKKKAAKKAAKKKTAGKKKVAKKAAKKKTAAKKAAKKKTVAKKTGAKKAKKKKK